MAFDATRLCLRAPPVVQQRLREYNREQLSLRVATKAIVDKKEETLRN
jgi:hypothetical protein